MKHIIRWCFLLLFCLISCKKANEWLNAPRTKTDVIFSTLKDYQALLNNTSVFNNTLPTIGLIGSDNIIVSDQFVQNLPVVERNSYLWNIDIFEGRTSWEYSLGYQAINYANVVLGGIDKLDIDASNIREYESIKGQAHFFRALFYFELANLFCKPFVSGSAKSDPGLCLRTKSDINEIVSRSTIYDTYKLILEDAKKAAELLPLNSTIKTQPSRAATYMLLSRVYLNMSDYEASKMYADSTLIYASSLLDFNSEPSLNLPYRFPDFKGMNREVIFYAQGNLYQTIFPSDNVAFSTIDTLLYREFDQNDLRRVYFFNEIDSVKVKFKGSYTGTSSNFCGLGVNEVLLNRAECNARLGDLTGSLRDLNQLLHSRYKKGTYVNFISSNQDSIIRKVLQERRKELPFTGCIRWQDLRRLNLDPSLATTIYRKVRGIVYEMKPNDNRFVYPFPQSEINLSGIEQNPR